VPNASLGAGLAQLEEHMEGVMDRRVDVLTHLAQVVVGAVSGGQINKVTLTLSQAFFTSMATAH